DVGKKFSAVTIFQALENLTNIVCCDCHNILSLFYFVNLRMSPGGLVPGRNAIIVFMSTTSRRPSATCYDASGRFVVATSELV
ncbi:MAG TPA: hypothetical protein VG498_01650, partial [Terriglobales bacterium]|nr:hypothetical protein [Terriglobales bacterium]